MKNIPFSPPDISEAEVQEVVEALRSGWITTGPRTKELERQVAAFCGTQRAACLNSQTACAEMALRVLGIGPGDEVTMPAVTFIATMAYPLSVGAKIVFADIDPETINLDPADVARKITPKTKMIVPVHLGGYPVDMDPIMELAKKHNLIVLEDAAHAFGGEYKGKKLDLEFC